MKVFLQFYVAKQEQRNNEQKHFKDSGFTSVIGQMAHVIKRQPGGTSKSYFSQMVTQ